MTKVELSIDPEFIRNTLRDLVKINSINPSLSQQGAGEGEIGTYIADSFSTIGLEVKTFKLAPRRVNVVGTLKGRKSGRHEGRSLLLNAHMDTVGVEGMDGDPFAAEIRGDRLYGRGAQDMKGSLAAMIAAAKGLRDNDVELGGDLLLTAVADEEHASIGTENLVRQVTADGAIVTEPTNLTISRAHRGFIWFDVETFGKAAHGSRFDEGIDANMHMGRFLSRLEALEKELRNRAPHPLAGPPSLHAARIHGGAAISIYAAHCLLQIERRTSPGETNESATEELQEIIDTLQKEDPRFKAAVKLKFSRMPFHVAPDSRIVQKLESACIHRLGTKPYHTGQTYWTDAALLSEAGIETAVFGPIGGGLHSAIEWVDLRSVNDLAYILAETAIMYCK